MTDKPPHEADRLLTVAEAAQQLCCSPTNLYALISSGGIPVVRIGRSKGYRIHPADLRAFIDRRTEHTQTSRSPLTRRRPRLKHIKF